MVESEFTRNVHLSSYLTVVGVPAAVGHDVKGDANGWQYWLVGLGPDVAAHGVRKS
jgi:hypothetical protein